MCKILYSNRSSKFLDKLLCGQPKHAKQISGKINDLLENPEPPDRCKLKNCEPFLRIDTGEYRIVYAIKDIFIEVKKDEYRKSSGIYIALIGKRNGDEIYNKLTSSYKSIKLEFEKF